MTLKFLFVRELVSLDLCVHTFFELYYVIPKITSLHDVGRYFRVSFLED